MCVEDGIDLSKDAGKLTISILSAVAEIERENIRTQAVVGREQKVELKACDFEPEFISQSNMYQNVVDDILRHPDDKPTIGLLLVKGKN